MGASGSVGRARAGVGCGVGWAGMTRRGGSATGTGAGSGGGGWRLTGASEVVDACGAAREVDGREAVGRRAGATGRRALLAARLAQAFRPAVRRAAQPGHGRTRRDGRRRGGLSPQQEDGETRGDRGEQKDARHDPRHGLRLPRRCGARPHGRLRRNLDHRLSDDRRWFRRNWRRGRGGGRGHHHVHGRAWRAPDRRPRKLAQARQSAGPSPSGFHSATAWAWPAAQARPAALASRRASRPGASGPRSPGAGKGCCCQASRTSPCRRAG
jgi:hypothetical protein